MGAAINDFNPFIQMIIIFTAEDAKDAEENQKLQFVNK